MAGKAKNFLKSNLLTILTVASVIIGITIGIILREAYGKFNERNVLYINFPGELFLQMLKSLILPLVISSLVSAVGSLDLSVSGKIGGRAVAYYMATTIFAVILGIILVMTIKPGVSSSNEFEEGQGKKRQATTADTFLDLIRNMFPPNLIQACTQQYQTVLTPDPATNETVADIEKWHIGGEFINGMNILGLVVASCTVGIAISSSKEQAQWTLQLFQELAMIAMKITSWVIWLSPIGVLFLICAKIVEMDDPGDLVGKLGLYFATVLSGILFHGFVILPLIYFLITRKNPFSFLKNMGQVMATAFATSSSSATLPLTIQCLEEKNGIDPRVTRFVLPIGATINMDGTALYEAVAAIFIAQIRSVDLSFGQLIAISITATAASIGAAGIPQAGLVTMVMVLDTVGLPAEDVSIILAVDWLLDRFRTVINVLGDSLGAGIVNHISRDELKSLDDVANGKISSVPTSCCDTLVISDNL